MEGLKNYNLEDTYLGNPGTVLRQRNCQGLLKAKSHEIVKSCPVRIMTDFDISWKISVLKESWVILG